MKRFTFPNDVCCYISHSMIMSHHIPFMTAFIYMQHSHFLLCGQCWFLLHLCKLSWNLKDLIVVMYIIYRANLIKGAELLIYLLLWCCLSHCLPYVKKWFFVMWNFFQYFIERNDDIASCFVFDWQNQICTNLHRHDIISCEIQPSEVIALIITFLSTALKKYIDLFMNIVYL